MTSDHFILFLYGYPVCYGPEIALAFSQVRKGIAFTYDEWRYKKFDGITLSEFWEVFFSYNYKSSLLLILANVKHW